MTIAYACELNVYVCMNFEDAFPIKKKKGGGGGGGLGVKM